MPTWSSERLGSRRERHDRAITQMINPDEAKQIYDFFVYDSKVRKADLYQQRQLKESSK